MANERQGMSDGDVFYTAIIALLVVVCVGICTKGVLNRIDRLEATLTQKESPDAP